MADQFTVQVNLKGSNQLSAPVGQAQQSLRGLTQEAGRANQAFSSMQSVLGGVFAGVTLAGVARLAGDLYATGMEAQRAGNLFRSFNTQIGDTDALLARLRVTTRGVVTDTELMNAANSALSMGLAKSADDVNRLMNIGVTFAQAMGEDVGASLENLNMILANQSYLRLDSLGISSAEVRVLAEQYRRAGMDSSEAFNQAFLDVAERKLPQMAAVADAMVTPLQQLQTSLDVWWTDFGNRFAQGVNGLIGLVDHLDEILTHLLSGQGPTEVAGVAGDIADNARLPPVVLNGMNMPPRMYAQWLAMQGRLGPYWESMYDLTGPSGSHTGAGWWSAFTGMGGSGRSHPIPYSSPWRGATANGLQNWSDVEALLNRRADLQFRFGDIESVLARTIAAPSSSGADAGVLADAVNSIAALRQEAERLDLSPEFLSHMDQVAETARRLSENAARTADEFERASLAQMFGQTSGGRLGELSDIALSAAGAAGMGGDQLSGLQFVLDRYSGRTTAASDMFAEGGYGYKLLGELAQVMTADAYAAMLANVQAEIDRAGTEGGPINLTRATGGYFLRPGGGDGDYTVRPGDTVGGIAAARGLSIDEVMAAAGISNPRLLQANATLNFGGELMQSEFWANAETSMSNISEDAASLTDDMQSAVDTLDEGIKAVFGKRQTLEIDLSVLGKDKLSQLFAELVNGAGGVTPGSSPKGGRSNTGRTQVNA